jgi:hypothetical protein
MQADAHLRKVHRTRSSGVNLNTVSNQIKRYTDGCLKAKRERESPKERWEVKDRECKCSEETVASAGVSTVQK